jgi:uncharacterized membrane protein YccC
MGAGAMLVGVAWRVGGGPPPIALLTVDALLMALSTLLGSASGAYPLLHIAVLFVWALLAGLLAALGRRGAVVGTQALIGIVVFGRFAEPLPGALGLAGLVLAGGLAMVLFAALVRWPSPLTHQRRAVAKAYRSLAELAPALGASTLPAATLLDQARAALSSSIVFDDVQSLALQSLVDEASRLRVELRAIHVLLDPQTTWSVTAGDARERATEALRESSRVLSLIADTLDPHGVAAPATAPAPGAAPSPAPHAAPTAAPSPAPSAVPSPASVAAPRAARGTAPTGTPLDQRLDALSGQLRAMVRSVPDAALPRGFPAGRARRARIDIARPRESFRTDVEQLRANATLQSPAGRHALRLAVVVALAEILAQHVPLQRSYWMVVAAATALRPEFTTTFTRSAERILGTCAGVALAGLIVVGLHPSLGVVVPIVAVLAWSSYSVFPASFAAGFGFLTALVVFLLDAVSPDTLATASDRLLDTLAGGAIGLLAYVLWPTWSRTSALQALADVVRAQRSYLALVLGAIVRGAQIDERAAAPLARQARVAFTTAQETVARSLDEPSSRRIDAAQSHGILAALRRLIGVTHVLRSEAASERANRPLPALAPLADELAEALAQIADALSAGPSSERNARSTAAPLVLPRLRESYSELARRANGADELLLRELDEMVDTANSLGALAADRR